MNNPLMRRHYDLSLELLYRIVEGDGSILRQFANTDEPVMLVHEDVRPAMVYAVSSPSIGAIRLSDLMEQENVEDGDIDIVRNLTDMFIEDESEQTLLVALNSVYEKVCMHRALVDAVEAVEVGDVSRESVLIDGLSRRIADRKESSSPPDTFIMGEDDATEEMNIDRDGFIPTNTVFDSWTILGPGELGMILAPPGVGKTTALVAICSGMAVSRKGLVIHFSEEMRMGQVMRKYATHLLDDEDITTNGIRKHKEMILGMLGGPNLVIESHKTGTSTVKFLENRAEQIREKVGSDIIGIGVDYASILKSLSSRGKRVEELSDIIIGLKGMASMFNCPVWSAAQPQRDPTKMQLNHNDGRILGKKFEPPVLTMADVGECWAYSQVADVLYSINQTQQEREEKIPAARIHNAKTREPKRGAEKKVTIKVNMYYPTCTIM